MVLYKEQMVQRPLYFAIIDEVDSILVDEARTPLIISGQAEKSTELYYAADRFVSRLKEEEDYHGRYESALRSADRSRRGEGRACFWHREFVRSCRM